MEVRNNHFFIIFSFQNKHFSRYFLIIKIKIASKISMRNYILYRNYIKICDIIFEKKNR